MAEYEFTTEENRSIDELHTKLSTISVMLVVAGVSLMIFAHSGETPRAIWFEAMLAAALIILGLVYYRPVDNLKRVTGTAGHDILIMMMAMNDLRIAFARAQVIFVFLIIMALAQLSWMLGF